MRYGGVKIVFNSDVRILKKSWTKTWESIAYTQLPYIAIRAYSPILQNLM